MHAALSALLFMSILVSACGGTEPVGTLEEHDPPVSWSMLGFNFPSWWHDDYLDPQAAAALDRLAATGANWVAIAPTQYMTSAMADEIVPEEGGRSATDESVEAAIDEAHERGLKVMLKPHVDVADGTWRGEISPEDPDRWFESYRTMIITYARLADRHGVELLCVGTEFASMEKPVYHGRWTEIIEDLRSVYGGELTYGASINSYESMTFWGELDYLGLSFYYPISDAATPSLEELMAGWNDYSGFYGDEQDWMGRLESWQEQWQKPVIFTEIGYRSIEYAARTPWEYESTGVYNGSAQANAYLAAFEAMKDKSWFAGMFWWNWGVRADSCGAGNTDYTICGKPAEDVVTAAFSRY
jgi:hypothetical protein